MKLKEIVIGHSLEAVLYAYTRDCDLIINSLRRPFEFDDVEEGLGRYQFETKNKLEIWSSLVLELALDGACPFGDSVESIRVEGNTLRVIPESGTAVEVEFEKCFIFDDENVTVPNRIIEKANSEYRVIDWFNVRTGTTHEFDQLLTGEDFVGDLYFYKSRRIDGAHNKKDLVTVSYLREDQLQDFQFSETMAKFKAQSIMKDHGIKGSRSGISKNGKVIYYSVRIEPDYRYIEPLGKNKYEDSENVKFLDLSLSEI
tara:strand:- start:360 stop:1130 length:771 start_codon:yes stop_codon:yes gene_type:complete